MSVQMWARVIIAISFSAALMSAIHRNNKRERGMLGLGEGRGRYDPVLSPYVYPLFILIMFPVALLMENSLDILRRFVFIFFEAFLYISLYYAVLLAGMPYLRRHISSRVCASLWIFPTYFYMFHRAGFEWNEPKALIHIPGNSWIFCLVWAVGFVVVLGWKCMSHMYFRKKLLGSAKEVTDAMAMRIWGEEQTEAMVYRRYGGKDPVFYIPIVQSSMVNTPMTIGLWKSSMYMVMPEKRYTEEELRLIFRHELIHIGRQDSGTKFFLVFCAAMGWFNPLMWMAMRRTAEDLELSCDETVLLQADPEERRRYARLLLETAGNDRGFSTCLSATGESMRYRLRQVTEAPPRKLGVVVAGVVLFVLFMGFGHITLAYDQTTAGEVIYQSTEEQSYILTRTSSKVLGEDVTFDEQTADALRQYLSGLSMVRLSGEYTFDDNQDIFIIYYKEPSMALELSDHTLTVHDFTGRLGAKTYYLSEPVDWPYLYDLLSTQG